MTKTKTLIITALLLTMSLLAFAPAAEARPLPTSASEACDLALSRVGGHCEINPVYCHGDGELGYLICKLLS